MVSLDSIGEKVDTELEEEESIEQVEVESGLLVKVDSGKLLH